MQNRYKIVSLLGKGGMGQVFEVQDLQRDGERIALKMLQTDRLDAGLMELFKAEFELLASLRHPHIARVYDFGIEQGRPFFTSELIAGESIYKATQNATRDEILEMTVMICRALEYLGSRGIIHGDLKPSNILVERGGLHPTLKILDFGIAPEFRQRITGTILGTPDYMAPEASRGDPVDARADLYALGVLLYSLLTRRKPGDDSAPTSPLNDAARQRQSVQANLAADHLPAELSNLLARLLEPNPQDRFYRANQVIDEISRITGKTYDIETADSREGLRWSARFVGRSAQFERLKHLHYRVALVEGEPGVGKTRLLRELKSALQVRGVQTFWLTPRTALEPLANVQRLFAPLLALAGKTAVAQPNRGQDEGSLNRYHAALAAVYLGTAQEVSAREGVPIVLFIDGADRLSPDEQIFLRFFAQELLMGALSPMHMVLAVSDRERWRLRAAQPLWLLQETLKPLGRDDLSEMLASVLSRDISPQVLAQIEAAARGNPFLALEYVQALLDTAGPQVLSPALAGVEAPSVHAPLTTSMQRFFNERMSGFPPDERLLVEVLAISRLALPAELIGSVLPEDVRPSFPRLVQLLGKLKHKSLVRSEFVGTQVVYGIDAGLLKDALAGAVSVERRLQRHAALAAELEKHRSDLNVGDDVLAYHYVQSGQGERALVLTLAAAAMHESQGALNSALADLEVAEKILGNSRPAPESEHARVWLSQARLGRLTGGFDRALAALQRLEKLHWLHADPQQAVAMRCDKAEMLLLKGQVTNAFEELERALRQVESMKDLGAHLRVLGLRGRVLYRLGRFDQMIHEAQAGLELCQTPECFAEQAELYYSRGLAHSARGQFAQAREDLERSLSLYDDLEMALKSAYPLNGLGVIEFQQGHLQEAIDAFTRAYEVAKREGDVRLTMNFAMNIGTIFHQRCQFGQAQDFYEKALVAAQRMQHGGEEAKVIANLGYLYLQYGDFARAAELLEESLSAFKAHGLADEIGAVLAMLGEVEAERGDEEKAERYYQAALEDAQRQGNPRRLVKARHGLASTALRRGQREQARKHLQAAAATLEQCEDILDARFDHHWYWADFYLEGGSREAETYLDRCEEIGRELEDRPRLWGLTYLQGRLEELRGDITKARQLYARALDLAHDYAERIPESERHYFFATHLVRALRARMQAP